MECLWKLLISLGKTLSDVQNVPYPQSCCFSRNLIIHTCCLFPVVDDFSSEVLCHGSSSVNMISLSPTSGTNGLWGTASLGSAVQTFGSGTLLMPKPIWVENIQSILHVVPLWSKENGKQCRRRAARIRVLLSVLFCTFCTKASV